MLVAQYTPARWRSLAYGAKFVLALGVAGLTVMLAGWVFDTRGSFDLLYVWLGSAAIVAAMAGRPVAPAGEDPSSAGTNPPPCPRAPTERGTLSCRRLQGCRRASKTKRRRRIS